MVSKNFTEEAIADAEKKAEDKHDPDALTPAVTPEDDLDLTPATQESVKGYEKYSSNDGKIILNKLDDGTTVEAGNTMESEKRAPAHQQHELAIETTAPGAKQAAALMTPRGTRGDVGKL